MKQKKLILVLLFDLIDTQWNVNSDYTDKQIEEDMDLIDTQWNVNKYRLILNVQTHKDLIDTQWNVNYEKAYHMAEKEQI